MGAVRAVAKGLSAADLEHIRDSLASGRKPKVMFTESAGQVAGQVGQVVALTDPQLSDEWLTVRFGRDELPFSPADLLVAPKAAAPNGRGRGAAPSPRSEPPAEPAPAPPAAPVGEPSTATPPPAPVQARSTGVDVPHVEAAEAVPSPAAPATKPAGRKGARPKVPASLTVTLAYAEGQWTVGATQGAKALMKPQQIRAAEALKMVSLLEVPGVREAVEEIVAAARVDAERQADRLRTELAEIEARLAELRAGM